SPALRSHEKDYFNTMCFSALPTALVAASSGFFIGLGLTKVVIWINCVGLVANALSDYLLISGRFGIPAVGIAGAGIATALANWCAAFFGFYLVLQKQNEETYGIRSGWRIDLSLMKRFMRYGVPSGLRWSLEGLAFTVFLIV